MADLPDSGARRTFATGSVRDLAEGKGTPWAMPPAALLRVARHTEAGGRKYGNLNYRLGQPVSEYLNSGLRHILSYIDGCAEEDHLAAAAWNLLGAIQTEIDVGRGWLPGQLADGRVTCSRLDIKRAVTPVFGGSNAKPVPEGEGSDGGEGAQPGGPA